MSRPDFISGDLRVVDDDDKGFSIYHVNDPDGLICWFNLKGERELLHWLNEKPFSEREMPPLGGVTKRKK